MRYSSLAAVLAVSLLLVSFDVRAQGPLPETGGRDLEPVMEPVTVADPIEPVNRFFFHFNDKLYFWLLKPISTGYKTVVPHKARVGVDNAFDNLRMPVRAVNCTLQGDFKGTGVELGRFVINTTWGVAGLMDPARNKCGLAPRKEDTGQTLGRYGAGSGFFINWPIFGPSNLRDSIGRVGDILLDPLTYLSDPSGLRYALRGTDRVNGTSLQLGEYEEFKEGALDPYISLRDAYEQYRKKAVEE